MTDVQQVRLRYCYRLLKIATTAYLAVMVYCEYRLAFATGGMGLLPISYMPYGITLYSITFQDPALWLGLVVALIYELTDILYIGVTLQFVLLISSIGGYIDFLGTGLPNSISNILLQGVLSLMLLTLLVIRHFLCLRPPQSGWLRPVSPSYLRFLKGAGITLWVLLLFQFIQYRWVGGGVKEIQAWYIWIPQALYAVFLGYFIFSLPKRPRPMVVYLIIMIPMLAYGCLLGLGIVFGPTTFLCKLEGLLLGALVIIAIYHWIRDFIL